MLCVIMTFLEYEKLAKSPWVALAESRLGRLLLCVCEENYILIKMIHADACASV